MTKLGLGARLQAELNPRLIYCSLKGFLSGPYSHRAALDEIAQMMGGLAYMTGPPGRPLRAGASVIDMMGGMFAVDRHDGGAARARENRPRPAHHQRAVRELRLARGPAHDAVRHYGPGRRGRCRSASRPGASTTCSTASDGQLFIGVVTDTQWKVFCEAFGFDEMWRDETLATNNQRCAARPTADSRACARSSRHGSRPIWRPKLRRPDCRTRRSPSRAALR